MARMYRLSRYGSQGLTLGGIITIGVREPGKKDGPTCKPPPEKRSTWRIVQPESAVRPRPLAVESRLWSRHPGVPDLVGVPGHVWQAGTPGLTLARFMYPGVTLESSEPLSASLAFRSLRRESLVAWNAIRSTTGTADHRGTALIVDDRSDVRPAQRWARLL